MFKKTVAAMYKEEPFAKPLNLADYPHVHTSDLLKIANYLPKCGVGGPWIAGGSVWRTINNEPLNKCDIDVFFHDKKQFDEAVAQMDAYPFVRNVLQKTKSKFNITYKIHANRGDFNKTIEVQFINMKYHKSIDALLQNFDLTVCQFGWNGENIFAGNNSINDLKSRSIRVYRVENPKSLFEHMLKYMNNGFTIHNDDTKKLINTIISLNPWHKDFTKGYDDPYEKNYKEKDTYRGTATGGTLANYITTTAYVNDNTTTTARNNVVWDEVDVDMNPRPVEAVQTPNTMTREPDLVMGDRPEHEPLNLWANTPTTPVNTDEFIGEPVPVAEVDPAMPTGMLYQGDVTPDMNVTPERVEQVDRAIGIDPAIRNVTETVHTGVGQIRMTQRYGGIENEIQNRMNTPRYETPRAPRGPARFDEDRRNPQYRNVFEGNVGRNALGQTEEQAINAEPRRMNNGEQQERR